MCSYPLTNTSAYVSKSRWIYFVSEVDTGSMIDQFFDNFFTSFIGCCHESCLLTVQDSMLPSKTHKKKHSKSC